MKKLFAARFLLDAAGRLVVMAVIIVLSRLLGVENFGKLAFGISVVSIGYYFCDFGIQTIFPKEMGQALLARQHEIWREFLGLKIVLAAGVFLLGACSAVWIWPWENPGTLAMLYIAMIGNSFVDFTHYACNVYEDLKSSAYVMVFHRSLSTLGPLVGVMIAPRVETVAIGLAAGSFIGMVGGMVIAIKRLRLPIKPSKRPQDWMLWLKKAAPLAVANILIVSYMKFGVLFLPWLGRHEEVGYYGAAHRLFEVAYILPAALMAIAMPRLARKFIGSFDLFRVEVRKIGQIILVLMAGFLIIGEPLGERIIRIVFGDAYRPAVAPFRILLLVNAVFLINAFLAQLMVVYNRVGRHLVHVAVCFFVSVGATLLAITQFGMQGAAWALFSTELLFMGLTLWSLRTWTSPRKYDKIPPLSSVVHL